MTAIWILIWSASTVTAILPASAKKVSYCRYRMVDSNLLIENGERAYDDENNMYCDRFTFFNAPCKVLT
jgi:hypothetical protein